MQPNDKVVNYLQNKQKSSNDSSQGKSSMNRRMNQMVDLLCESASQEVESSGNSRTSSFNFENRISTAELKNYSTIFRTIQKLIQC